MYVVEVQSIFQTDLQMVLYSICLATLFPVFSDNVIKGAKLSKHDSALWAEAH